MRIRRLLSATFTLLLAAVLSFAFVSPASAAAPSYVALGDSYSSGVGAGSYDSASGDCRRSAYAYPRLWANANSPASFSFVACSGATTASVTSSQLGALSSTTGLVSISVGGNDVGFADVMTDCVLWSTSTCVSAVNAAINEVRTILPGNLDRLYSQIRSRSPNAQVFVLGYPRFYQLNGTCVVGMTETERAAINNGADVLNSVIAQRAAAAGFTFVDIAGPFTGHGICSGSSWLHSVTLPVYESYHPTRAGQTSGYLPAFSAAV
ncbi:SGNH/GDSL hydrolase family protein [Allostreptomyces psammosilenae]|uniref:Lysophospholipase L1-like esterase n=1 Tax=Allostreptomyces psammosilenae TaxID=1892865 RepID=A0A852ZZM4_9ACTN|nr:SGNH/GDSL hydrolase family protein [Allostreptomyces psammosilenae]NYI04031.1 lysophospholipase L1-like esterase [Allostreptomyces psammosilenae]